MRKLGAHGLASREREIPSVHERMTSSVHDHS